MNNTERVKDTDKNLDRVLWKLSGNRPGPVVVIFAGIHGNEPAGLKAVKRVSEKIGNKNGDITGTVYAIRGNIKALNFGIRFIDHDLNRVWEDLYETEQIDKRIEKRGNAESEEFDAIQKCINIILDRHKNETDDFIFTDIHTTSSNSCSFILFNDTLKNRQLAGNFPAPQILGIEEFVRGTLLSYINNLGYTAIGFEAGAHTDSESINRSESYIWLLLYYCRIIDLSDEDIQKHEANIETYPKVPGRYFEIVHHHFVEDPSEFAMKSGFENFDHIEKDQPLACENGRLVKAPSSGRIFMPLYQEAGNDGFFIIREISPFWLKVSAYLRRSVIHKTLKFLPGVSQINENSLEIDLRIAKFLVKDIFHLLGYRIIRKDEDTLICFRR